MNCELCGDEADVICTLPIHQPSGSLITMACEKCARKSLAYCTRHETVHQGFADGSTACLRCIEDLVTDKDLVHAGQELYDIVTGIITVDEKDELDDCMEWSAHHTGEGRHKALLRFVASKALRTGVTFEKIAEQIRQERSVRCILR